MRHMHAAWTVAVALSPLSTCFLCGPCRALATLLLSSQVARAGTTLDTTSINLARTHSGNAGLLRLRADMIKALILATASTKGAVVFPVLGIVGRATVTTERRVCDASSHRRELLPRGHAVRCAHSTVNSLGSLFIKNIASACYCTGPRFFPKILGRLWESLPSQLLHVVVDER